MNKLISTRTILAAATLGVLSALSFSSGANAADDSLKQCRFDNKMKVVNCCKQYVKRHGKPEWLLTTGMTCNTAAVCLPKKGRIGIANFNPRRCYIRFNPAVGPYTGGGTSPTPAQRPQGNGPKI